MNRTIGSLIYGVAISLLTALFFMLIAQAWAGGVTSFRGESWLYFAVVIPFAITFIVLGNYFFKRNEVSKKRLWMISFISAFLVTLFSGTIGAIIGEMIVRGGLDTINVKGTLVWGTIYAFLLLPITTLFARFIIGMFYELIKRMK